MQSKLDILKKIHSGKALSDIEADEANSFFDTLFEYANFHGLTDFTALVKQDKRLMEMMRMHDRKLNLLNNNGKEHRVSKGETLASITQHYLGNPARWQELVLANLDRYPVHHSWGLNIDEGDILYLPDSWEL